MVDTVASTWSDPNRGMRQMAPNFDPRAYSRNMLKMIEYVRAQLGDKIELLHDIQERLHPIDAVQFAKDVEQYKLYFLEDALASEDIGWFRLIRH